MSCVKFDSLYVLSFPLTHLKVLVPLGFFYPVQFIDYGQLLLKVNDSGHVYPVSFIDYGWLLLKVSNSGHV